MRCLLYAGPPRYESSEWKSVRQGLADDAYGQLRERGLTYQQVIAVSQALTQLAGDRKEIDNETAYALYEQWHQMRLTNQQMVELARALLDRVDREISDGRRSQLIEASPP